MAACTAKAANLQLNSKTINYCYHVLTTGINVTLIRQCPSMLVHKQCSVKCHITYAHYSCKAGFMLKNYVDVRVQVH